MAEEPFPPPLHKVLRLPKSCATLPELDTCGSRAFEYFLHRVAPVLGGELDAQFWRVLLPRISYADSSVRYAVLTISHFYELGSGHIAYGGGFPEKSKKLLLRWHCRSLSKFRSRMAKLRYQDDCLLALLSCVLLTNIEFQRNNALNACNLLRCGNALTQSMRQSQDDDSDCADNPWRTIAQMLVRQRVLMAIFGHCDPEERSEPPSSLPKHSNSLLDTLTQGRHFLSDCQFETLQLMRAASNADVGRTSGGACKFSLRKLALLQRLEYWHQNFLDMQLMGQEQSSPAEDIAAKILLVHSETALVWASASLQPETAFDGYTDHFERKVQLAAEITCARRNEGVPSIVYSFKMGMVAPL